jgi:hypothetical protein
VLFCSICLVAAAKAAATAAKASFSVTSTTGHTDEQSGAIALVAMEKARSIHEKSHVSCCVGAICHRSNGLGLCFHVSFNARFEVFSSDPMCLQSGWAAFDLQAWFVTFQAAILFRPQHTLPLTTQF